MNIILLVTTVFGVPSCVINLRNRFRLIYRTWNFIRSCENTKTRIELQLSVRMQISIKWQFDKTDR